jgi:hypothetical protein
MIDLNGSSFDGRGGYFLRGSGQAEASALVRQANAVRCVHQGRTRWGSRCCGHVVRGSGVRRADHVMPRTG